jgi:hypothetical protein
MHQKVLPFKYTRAECHSLREAAAVADDDENDLDSVHADSEDAEYEAFLQELVSALGWGIRTCSAAGRRAGRSPRSVPAPLPLPPIRRRT